MLIEVNGNEANTLVVDSTGAVLALPLNVLLAEMNSCTLLAMFESTLPAFNKIFIKFDIVQMLKNDQTVENKD